MRKMSPFLVAAVLVLGCGHAVDANRALSTDEIHLPDVVYLRGKKILVTYDDQPREFLTDGEARCRPDGEPEAGLVVAVLKSLPAHIVPSSISMVNDGEWIDLQRIAKRTGAMVLDLRSSSGRVVFNRDEVTHYYCVTVDDGDSIGVHIQLLGSRQE